MSHPWLLGGILVLLLAGGTWGALARFNPELLGRMTHGRFGWNLLDLGAAAVVIFQAIRTLDRRFRFDAQQFALDHFSDLVYPWQDTYRSIEIAEKEELDRFVITVGHPQLLEDRVTYGIMVSRIADILAGGRFGSVRNLDDSVLLEMMIGQKLDHEEHQARMDRLLRQGVRSRSLLRAVRSHRAGQKVSDSRFQSEDLEMLLYWLDQSRFQLRIDSSVQMDHLASQLSVGYVDIKGEAGHNCLSYMGLHSSREDFPVALVGGNVGDSLGTNMRRGFIYCAGDAGSDVGKTMSGGTIVIGGAPGNRFGNEMDDSNHPSVLIAYRAPRGYLPLEGVRNGLMLLLNRDVEEAPKFLRFRDGAQEVLPGAAIDMESQYEAIRNYVNDWKELHGPVWFPGPQEAVPVSEADPE
jgi:hypothetical protein